MAVDGVIAKRARAVLPVTWDALSQDSRFGDDLIQTAIDTTKERVLGSVITPTLEGTLPLIVIDYVAKLVVLELINPGLDYWHREGPTVIQTTGTNETETYIDPVATLRDLRTELLAETRLAWNDVKPLIGYTRLSNAPRPAINTLNDEFLTPSPQEFPRPYRATDRS